MEFDEAEQWELLWALLYWRASVPPQRRMSDPAISKMIERVRGSIHHREPDHVE